MTPRGRVAFGLACLAGAGLIVGVHANTLQNALHFDDLYVVQGNVSLRSLDIRRFFTDASTGTSMATNAVYRPLVTTSLALDYWLGGGLSLRQFHLSQLAMHLLLVGSLVAFYRRVIEASGARRWGAVIALVGAVLFGVHTTGTETLNLMHARSELLSGLGVVGSFLVYLAFPWLRWTGLYLLPMVGGALAKSPAVMFAPLLLVYIVLFEERLSLGDVFQPARWPRVWTALRKSLPALLVGVATFVAVTHMDAPSVNYGGAGRIDYLRTQLFVWLHYARLFVLPVGLTADTDWTIIDNWSDTRVIAGIGFVGLLLRGIWRASEQDATRPVAFGLAWFALALLPASSIMPLAEVSNEHRTFFPYIGLTLAAVSGVGAWLERRAERHGGRERVLVACGTTLAVVAIAGNAAGSHVRNRTWSTEETLWKDVTEKSPANGRGLMNYGLALMAKGEYAAAKALFDRARVFNPNYAYLEINLGIVSGRLGDPVVAESHFTRALELQPVDPASYFFYGRWLAEQGRVADATLRLQQLVALDPRHVDGRFALLDAYAAAGRQAELLALVEETRRFVPGDPRLERYSQLALQQPPVSPVAPRPSSAATQTADDFLTSSLRAYQSGDFRGCIEAAQKALLLKPDSAEAYNNIAAGHAALREWGAAIAAAREALRIRPTFELARNNLAWAESQRAVASPDRK